MNMLEKEAMVTDQRSVLYDDASYRYVFLLYPLPRMVEKAASKAVRLLNLKFSETIEKNARRHDIVFAVNSITQTPGKPELVLELTTNICPSEICSCLSYLGEISQVINLSRDPA
jgi:hypothetical protein